MLTAKTPVRMPLSAFFAGLLSIGTIVGTAYGFHDRAISQINVAISHAVADERSARLEAAHDDRVAQADVLKRYIGREEFLQAWYKESAKRDFQYSELLMMMERVKNEMARRR